MITKDTLILTRYWGGGDSYEEKENNFKLYSDLFLKVSLCGTFSFLASMSKICIKFISYAKIYLIRSFKTFLSEPYTDYCFSQEYQN